MGRGPREYYEPKIGELDIHVLEAKAYTRLKEKGLCDRGIVPDFLGTLRKFDPRCCSKSWADIPDGHCALLIADSQEPDDIPLRHFLQDEYPPSAVFLEYIPGMETLTLETYTKERMTNLLHGIREIHEALVLHEDPKPRNMVIFPGSDKAMWIDFDRAETFDPERLTASEKQMLAEEFLYVVAAGKALEEDTATGMLGRALYLY